MPLKINVNIPYGNAANVLVEYSEDVPRIRYSPHPHGGPETLWFCFRIETTGEPVVGACRVILENFGNCLGGNRENAMCARPVLKIDGGDWERIAEPKLIEHPDGRLDLSWKLAVPARHATIAFCYPYGFPELGSLVRDSRGYWTSDTIGVSQQGRPIHRLSNFYGRTKESGASTGDGNPAKNPEQRDDSTTLSTSTVAVEHMEDSGTASRKIRRSGLYVVSRQHSAETSGGWALDGFLRRIAEFGDAAPLVWAVPISNPDGVEAGDYGKDNYPYDLNRAWGNPPMRHETLVISRDMQRWLKRCEPVIGLDFHSPGAVENSGVYAFLPNPDVDMAAYRNAKKWMNAIAGELGDYASAEACRIADYPSRWETPSFAEYCRKQGFTGISFEFPYAMAGDRVLERNDYRTIGAKIANAIVNLLGP